MFSIHSHTWLGNTVMDYFWFLVILVAGLLLRSRITLLVASCIYFITKRHSSRVGKQKLIQLLSEPLNVFITTVVVYMAFDKLVIPDEWNLAVKEKFGVRYLLYRLFDLMLIFSGFWSVLRMVDYTGLIFLSRPKKSASLADDQLVVFSKEAVKVLIGAVGLFILIGVAFQLDIVSLIAGLGIGGLAIALAAKETLENLLGSFTIFLDKPFVTGDVVRVGAIEGTVESVGFRSTRIRSTEKMLVTVPNKKMVDAELINETNRRARRSATSLIVNHETSVDQLKTIIAEINLLLSNNPVVERNTQIVRFRNFSDKGLEIYIVYVVLTADNNEFLASQESINFSIMKILRENNVILFQTPGEHALHE